MIIRLIRLFATVYEGILRNSSTPGGRHNSAGAAYTATYIYNRGCSTFTILLSLRNDHPSCKGSLVRVQAKASLPIPATVKCRGTRAFKDL